MRRSRGVFLAGLALAFVASAAATPPQIVNVGQSGGLPYVLNGDAWIGTYHVSADNTLYGAIKTWGQPTRRLAISQGRCNVIWDDLGVRAIFWGDPDPCAPQYGCIDKAFVTGKKWRTMKGLKIGDPRRYLFNRYAHGSPYSTVGRDGEWYWLSKRTRHGSAAPYGALSARLHDGWVTAFRVDIGSIYC